MLIVPRLWCARGARAWYDGDAVTQERLARGVARWVETGIGKGDFNTGSSQFDGEWLFGTYQMAGLGLAQVVRQHPETAAMYLPVIEKCIERMTSAQVAKFDTDAWGASALDTLDRPNGHAAYLGYLNLTLSAYREIAPRPKFTDLSDRITAALARRIAASPTGIVETYPSQSFPIDNMSGIASIAVYDRATGADHSAALRAWVDNCRRRYVDHASGLLVQCIQSDTGRRLDKPRASGAALGAYFMSFADMTFSSELYDALAKSCGSGFAGFGLVKEYPPNVKAGQGDIDSGPVVLGISFSGTGFAIAGARVHGDYDFFRALYRTSYLVGAPLTRGNTQTYVCGGPLGNAIMLAMLTAGGSL